MAHQEGAITGSCNALTTYRGELVAGGAFVTAYGVTVNRVARWDGASWRPLTSGDQAGVDGPSPITMVRAMAVYNGDLIVGGEFVSAGGQTVNHIARWDGTAWHALASGGQVGVGGGENFFNQSRVWSMAVWDGSLYVGGNFSTAGGQVVNRIARWDGTSWHALSAGGQIGLGGGQGTIVASLAAHDGKLVAGGNFTTAGGQTVTHIARWDGLAWHPFAAGGHVGLPSAVFSLRSFDGSLFAGGSFLNAGGQAVNRVARWDGAGWHPLASGGQTGVADGVGGGSTAVFGLSIYEDALVACGNFTTAGGGTVNHIARWDGAAWHKFAVGPDVGVDKQVYALAVWKDMLVAGGDFGTTVGGEAISRVAIWGPSPWEPLTAGGQTGIGAGDVYVQALARFKGDAVAAGAFATAGGQSMNGIARWDGAAWHPLATRSQPGTSGWVEALATVGAGELESLYVGGAFATAGAQNVNNVARWDGTTWHALVSGAEVGVNGKVRALVAWGGGVIAGGDFTTAGGQVVNHIARWDGTKWIPFAVGGWVGVNGPVHALAVFDGVLVAGGTFTSAGGQAVGRIARWNGTGWLPLGAGVSTEGVPTVMALLPHDGDLYVGGQFTKAGGQTVNNLARWDGAAWSALVAGGLTGLSGPVTALETWQGKLIVGGSFERIGASGATGPVVSRLAAWDGAEWTAIFGGSQVGASGSVLALRRFQHDLFVGGTFLRAGGRQLNGIGRLRDCDPEESSLPGDLNGDGLVDGQDIGLALASWGPCLDCDDCPGDVDGDCVVGGADLGAVLASWN
ncbi:MAG TPA: hypothetical protein PKC43_12740 [Phycisphaerales bacterium]|nr:hypothetical protein [Phycisphaerales bacterium]HMP38300.1 hypothetical protein [Phycisphaerales bacterium]